MMTQKPFEGDLLDLWKKAQDEFFIRTKLQHSNYIPNEILCDPLQWPEILKAMPPERDRFETVCVAIGQHMKTIQSVVDITTNVLQLVTVAAPVVAPANLVVQAFALVFRAFAKAHTTIEQIQKFFKEMEVFFTDISVLSGHLHGDYQLEILRKRVIDVFSCSLQICAIAIDGNKKFGKWIKSLLSGDDELDKLFSSMKSAKDNLIKCLNFSTYAEMRSAGHTIEVIESQLRQQDRTEILSWLSLLNFDLFHEQLLEQVKGRPNAGKWLLDSPAFQKWTKTKGSRLWYTGKPGAGKSVLSSIIVRHLASTLKTTMNEPTVAFLYMSHKAEPTVQQLLGSVARQLVADMLFVPRDVEAEWRNKANRGKGTDGQYGQPNEAVLERLIAKLIAGRPIFIILDAMDECKLNIRQELITKLQNISEDVRLLVTARLLEKRDELSRGFDMHTIEAQGSDIGEYIDFMIEKDEVLQQGTSNEIKRTVTRKSGGMFLLVKLHMHALSNLDDPDDIDEVLGTLPETVDESYANAISRVNKKDDARRKYARMVLAWMSYVFRPLNFKELSHAIAAQTSKTGVKLDKLLSKDQTMSFCCGLVEIDMDDVVRFVHYSAQDFFRRKKELEFYEFREQIPLACAKYLCMNVLTQLVRPTDSKTSHHEDSTQDDSSMWDEEFASDEEFAWESLEEYPFTKYAAEYLHQHLRIVRHQEKGTELFRYICKLIDEAPKRLFYYELLIALKVYYVHSTLLEGPRPVYRSRGQAAAPLHLSVFLGSPGLVESFIAKGSSIDEIDEFKQTPLALAFKRDFSDIAEMLLDHGATVDLSKKKGHVFLLYAAQRDFHNAVEKILASTGETESTWSPMDLAVLTLSPLLLAFSILKGVSRKPDPSPTTNPLRGGSEQQEPEPTEERKMLACYGRILSLAYDGQCDALSDFINSHGFADEDDSHQTQDFVDEASIYECDSLRAQDFLETACFLAVERGHTKIVDIFLRNGVDANLKNFHGQPLLHRATFRNKLELVRLILDSGADVNLEDDNRRTAFTAHATTEHEQVLYFLQERGANIQHTGKYEVHELYRAAAFGNVEMVRFNSCHLAALYTFIYCISLT